MKKTIALMLMIAATVVPSFVQAYEAEAIRECYPRNGQQCCYDSNGNIVCR